MNNSNTMYVLLCDFDKVKKYRMTGKIECHCCHRYLRVKRHGQTFFIRCDPFNTIKDVKAQVAVATNNELTADNMRLLLPKKGTILNDDDTLQTLSLKSDTVVHMVQQISENEWEPVDVFPDPIDVKSS